DGIRDDLVTGVQTCALPILGEQAVDAHMKGLFPDWRAKGVTVCLHEKQGGFAFNLDSVNGLAGKCASEGVAILSGVEVTGFEPRSEERRVGEEWQWWG